MKNTCQYGLFFLLPLFAFSWTVLGEDAVPKPEEMQKIKQAVPSQSEVKPREPRKLLIINRCDGFKHSSIPYWDAALTVMGEKTGAFQATVVSDMAVFTEEGLKDFDAVCFNNTTHLTFTDEQKQSLMNFVRGGRGIVGIHAAADNFYGWPEAQEMMSNIFTAHPWTAGGTWAVKIDDPDHPLMRPFEGKGFKINDEIYRTKAPLYSRDKVRVLMSLDMSDETTRTARGVEPGDEDTGISWVRSFGEGRVFYSGLGHTHHITWNPAVLEHVLLGIQYAFGDLEADATPQPEGKLSQLLEQAKDYEFGQSREVLTQIEGEIAAAGNSPDALKAIEGKLLATLAGPCSYAFRDFLCRQLSVIGTDQSVPALMVLLQKGGREANIARFALERNPSPVVDGLLLKDLMKADPALQVGIVTTLGSRQADGATAFIGDLLESPDAGVVSASLYALGQIGSKEAAAQLQKRIDTLADDQKYAAMDALLQCAENLRQQGDGASALAVYRTLSAQGNPVLIRVAALAGITETADTAAANQAILAGLDDPDLEMQSGVIRLACKADSAQAMAEIRQRMPGYPELLKVRFLAALEEFKRPVGREIAAGALTESSEAVRAAALMTLSKLGDETSVIELAQTAANASNRQIRDLARTALDQIGGEKVNAVIIREITECGRNAASTPACHELIGAAGRRQIRESMGLLTEIAAAGGDLQRPALQSIQQLAGPDDLESLVGLLKNQPNEELEKTIVIAAGKQEPPQGRASVLIKEYATLSDPTVKGAFLRVLGQIGDPAGYALIREGLDSSTAAVRDGARQGLFNWTGGEAINDLKPLVLKGEDERTKVLAYRAYLKVLREAGLSNVSLVSEATWAMKTAPRPDERKGVLAILADQNSSEALGLVVEAMEDPSLKGEAETAAVSICQKLLGSNPQQARSVLVKIQESTSSNSIKRRIEGILRR